MPERAAIAALAFFCALSCAAPTSPSESSPPLPSWTDGPTKHAIVEFVTRVTDPDHADFVPVADRVATLDNDGTLWCEKPLYIHLFALFAKLRSLR